jgi:hypothetical protein
MQTFALFGVLVSGGVALLFRGLSVDGGASNDR